MLRKPSARHRKPIRRGRPRLIILALSSLALCVLMGGGVGYTFAAFSDSQNVTVEASAGTWTSHPSACPTPKGGYPHADNRGTSPGPGEGDSNDCVVCPYGETSSHSGSDGGSCGSSGGSSHKCEAGYFWSKTLGCCKGRRGGSNVKGGVGAKAKPTPKASAPPRGAAPRPGSGGTPVSPPHPTNAPTQVPPTPAAPAPTQSPEATPSAGASTNASFA